MRLETSGRVPQQDRPLARAVRQSWHILLAAALCSGAVNVLALTGPIYMLEIYNGVLPSGSAAQLAALTGIMLALYAMSGLLDYARIRFMGRVGSSIDRHWCDRAFAIQQEKAITCPRGDGMQPLRDLEQIRTFVASSGLTAMFDLPWMPLYLYVIYTMHPLLGALATSAALILVTLMLAAEAASRSAIEASSRTAGRRWSFAAAALRNAEAARAMALNRNLCRRWSALNTAHGNVERDATRHGTAVGATIKVARPALQSATLGLGAYLFLLGEASAGAMIAASIILSRALAPLETAIAHSRGFGSAYQSYRRLTGAFATLADPPVGTPSPPSPRRRVRVDGLAVVPPGAAIPAVSGVAFALKAGDGLGIVGPSGSGKSTLARALVGVWPSHAGGITLDGHALSAWDPETLGRHIGYLPQDTALLAGSIAENIARFDADASERAIVSAAHAAGVHEMILHLKDGYATDVGDGGAHLPAGQRQRIALARALYGAPFLVVLDEPNANLDAEGDARLTAAITGVRRRGGIVVVIAHRQPALIAVDQVLALANGRVVATGPKQNVLARVLRPAHATTRVAAE